MRQRTLRVSRLGRLAYGAALTLQKETERAVVEGRQSLFALKPERRKESA